MRSLLGKKAAHASRRGHGASDFPPGPRPNTAEDAIFQLEQPDPVIACETAKMWRYVISCPPNPCIEDLAERPRVLVSATGAASLRAQLHGLHGGRPLVVLGLHSATGAGALGETCNALLDGVFPDGPGGGTAAGNLLFTDPSGILAQIAKGPTGDTGWLGRMLWLVDGDAGPGLPPAPASGVPARLDNMVGRFSDALCRAFGARLDNHNPGTTVHAIDLDEAQSGWAGFLRGMGDALPGIGGTGRQLLATLAFGLAELARDSRGLPRLPDGGVGAFARFLVRRMAGARAAILSSAGEAQKLHHQRRILAMLAGERLGERDLYRRLHLPADICRERLAELERDRIVRATGDKWERVEGASLPPAPAALSLS